MNVPKRITEQLIQNIEKDEIPVSGLSRLQRLILEKEGIVEFVYSDMPYFNKWVITQKGLGHCILFNNNIKVHEGMFSNQKRKYTYPTIAPRQKCLYSSSSTANKRISAALAPNTLKRLTLASITEAYEERIRASQQWISTEPIKLLPAKCPVRNPLIGKTVTQHSALYGFTVSDVINRNGVTWGILTHQTHGKLYRDIKLFEKEVA